jgi:hypothetical protein
MIASDLGVKNLKRIVPNLVEWTEREGEDYEELKELYNNVFAQLNRYLGHVTRNVGGIYKYTKTSDQNGAVFTHVEKEKQQRAVNFLLRHLYSTPSWLMDKQIFSYIDYTGHVDRIRSMQDRNMNLLFEKDRLLRLEENAVINDNRAYTLDLLFGDMKRGIFSNIRMENDPIRRGVQRAFVKKLAYLITNDDNDLKSSDIQAMAHGTLFDLYKELEKQKSNDRIQKYHIEELVSRIGEILDLDD